MDKQHFTLQENMEASQLSIYYSSKIVSTPTQKNKDGHTPLSLAVHKEQGHVVRRLLENGDVNWDAMGKNGYLWEIINSEYEADKEAQEATLQQLIECGQVDVEERHWVFVSPDTWESTEENTLLHRVAFKGYVGSVRLLLEKGSDVKARNSEGDTPLHTAVQNYCFKSEEQMEEIISLLLDKGADIEAKNHDGNTALRDAVTSEISRLPSSVSGGFKGPIQVLLEKGADINTIGQFGETPLMEIVWYHYLDWEEVEERARLLLEAGADVNIQDDIGNTALHAAAMNTKYKSEDRSSAPVAEIRC